MKASHRTRPTHTPTLPHPYTPRASHGIARLFLGVDGGGSQTRAMVMDATERVCYHVAGPPTNPYAVGFQTAQTNLKRVVNQVSRKANTGSIRFSAAFFGIAGLKTKRERDRVRDVIQEQNWAEQFEVGDDAHGAWAGALACEPGLVLLCGTGSKVYGMTADEKEVSVGGFGYLLGDEGSGAHIGLEALRKACQDLQGRFQSTRLTSLILDYMGFSEVGQLLDWVYSPGRSSRDFASLCPLVAGAAREGDEVARQIFKRAAGELAALVSVARATFPGDTVMRISYQGGVFQSGDVILKPLRRVLRRITPMVSVEQPRFSVVSGCVLLAMRKAGLRDAENILRLSVAHTT